MMASPAGSAVSVTEGGAQLPPSVPVEAVLYTEALMPQLDGRWPLLGRCAMHKTHRGLSPNSDPSV